MVEINYKNNGFIVREFNLFYHIEKICKINEVVGFKVVKYNLLSNSVNGIKLKKIYNTKYECKKELEKYLIKKYNK